MHEVGVMIEIVKTVENFAMQNNVTVIDKIVLQIGELSSVIPKYMEDCYPAAVDGTMMENTKLEIEVLPGNARCQNCGEVYNLIKQDATCPKCKSKKLDVLSGREFFIKEIVAC